MAFSPVTTVSIKVTSEPAWHRLREDLPHALLSNMGPEVVYIGFADEGAGSGVAMPVFPRTQLVLNKGLGCPGITAICDGENSLLLVTLGIGG